MPFCDSSRMEMKKIPIEMWDNLQKRVEAIYPFVMNQIPTTLDNISWQAKVSGVHVATIYRWLSRYKKTGDVCSLISPKKSGGEGKSRLQWQVDEKIDYYIKSFLLSKKKRTVASLIDDIYWSCEADGLTPPHPNTIRFRLKRMTCGKPVGDT